MSLSDKIKNAKRGHSLFDDIPPERMHALKMRGRVASVIAKKRQQLGMNQSEFAKFCGVTQPMVSKWESGEYNFTLDTWAELCFRLELPFDAMQTPPIDHSTIGSYNSMSSGSNSYDKVATAPNVYDFAQYRDKYYSECKEE